MIVSNPQDLTPLLAAMKAELKSDIETANTTLAQSVSGDTQRVIDDLATLTTVNGEINSEVQAINAHTTAEISALVLSPVKNVYRISTSQNSKQIIPVVNMDKTVVNVLSYGGSSSCYANLVSDTEVYCRPNGYTMYMEVIEYA
ncbi:hypothetical protein NB496_09210 [Vibrio alginolyticus]|uniref:hypothetical protein n=1 Tax=Vibrio harveyi group TaxID=717610 RepID=UPI00215CFAAC|nr:MULTISPECIES: hypothetical protein [Vibrio harveyi group]MCR9640808.1 hypothetical protein [Vibrio alginolyticus]MCS0356354.1 hypothetical protein [Vibrio diabolicus]